MTETTLAGTAAASEAAGRWPVAGHDWIVEQLAHTLADASSSGGPRHAYLFLGPRQVGKSTLVRAFAAALLCTGGGSRPCGACRSCRLMAAGSHPDFVLVQPLDKPVEKDGRPDRSGKFYVAQADEIVHAAALRPAEGRFKLFHIQDMHLAADSFANKLLKTLEEPPAHVVLCLSALDRSGLLPTVVSRCQLFDLRPVAPPAIEALLVGQHKAAPEQARLLARLANGRPGWAVDQWAHKDAWQEARAGQLETLWRLMSADRAERLAHSESLAANRNNAQLFNMLELWSVWWRDLMLAQAGCPDAVCNVDFQPVLDQQAAAISPRRVQDYLATLKRTEGYLRHTVNARLALDVLLLRLPRLAGGAEIR
jgi:DNA polymerase-3 subunit delta'